MRANKVAVIMFTIISCLLSLVSVSTDDWLVNQKNTISIGLFNICHESDCQFFLTGVSKITITLLITGMVEHLMGSIIIFIGWNKDKTSYTRVGLVLIAIGSVQFVAGCTIFTIFHPNYYRLKHWGLCFYLAWASSGLSVTATLIALCVLIGNHRRRPISTTPSKKERRCKLNTVLKEVPV